MYVPPRVSVSVGLCVRAGFVNVTVLSPVHSLHNQQIDGKTMRHVCDLLRLCDVDSPSKRGSVAAAPMESYGTSTSPSLASLASLNSLVAASLVASSSSHSMANGHSHASAESVAAARRDRKKSISIVARRGVIQEPVLGTGGGCICGTRADRMVVPRRRDDGIACLCQFDHVSLPCPLSLSPCPVT